MPWSWRERVCGAAAAAADLPHGVACRIPIGAVEEEEGAHLELRVLGETFGQRVPDLGPNGRIRLQGPAVHHKEARVRPQKRADGFNPIGEVAGKLPVLHEVELRDLEARGGGTGGIRPIKEKAVPNARVCLTADQFGEGEGVLKEHRDAGGQVRGELRGEVERLGGDLGDVVKDPKQGEGNEPDTAHAHSGEAESRPAGGHPGCERVARGEEEQLGGEGGQTEGDGLKVAVGEEPGAEEALHQKPYRHEQDRGCDNVDRGTLGEADAQSRAETPG